MDYKYEKIKTNKTYYRNKYTKIIFTSESFIAAGKNSINEAIKHFFTDLHKCVDEAQPNLFYERIVSKDFDEYHSSGYNGRMIICSDTLESNIKPKSMYESEEDVLSYIKAFEFRYCSRYNDKTKLDYFWCYRKIRAIFEGHEAVNNEMADIKAKKFFAETITYDEKNKCDKGQYKKAIKEFDKSIDDLKEIITSCIWGIDKERLNDIFSFYLEWFAFIDENLTRRFEEKPVSSNPAIEHSVYDFFCYDVIIPDETVSIGDYNGFIKNLQGCAKHVLPTKNAIEALKNIRHNKSDEKFKLESERAADMLKDVFLDYDRAEGKKYLEISDAENGREEISSILDKEIETARKSKLCILTEDEPLAKLVWKKAEENDCLSEVIVIKPVARDKAVVFKPVSSAGIVKIVVGNASSINETNIESNSKTGSEKNDNNGIISVETTPSLTVQPVQKPQPTTANHDEAETPVVQNKKAPGALGFRIPKKNDSVYIKFSYADEMVKVKLTEELGGGGEGTIFRSEDIHELIKIYKSREKAISEAEKISALVNIYDENDDKFLKICWPVAEVWDYSKKAIIGYAMEEAENCVSMEDILFDIIKSDESRYIKNRAQLVRICIEIAERFSVLHSIGNNTLMGDINLNNILVSINSNEVYFVDVDSYQFGEYLCNVGMPDFTSPKMHKKLKKSGAEYRNTMREKDDEYFAISVLFFYILMLGEFPFNNTDNTVSESIIKGYFEYSNDYKQKTRRNFIWQNLSDDIREAFTDCFRKSKFIDEEEWKKRLWKMLDLIQDGRLSNEIEPMCALQDADDEFITETCLDCSQKYITTKKTLESESVAFSEQRCQNCKKKRAYEQSAIGRIKCSKCNRYFTVNSYDCNKSFKRFNENDIVCPDCNKNLRYSKAGTFIDENTKEINKKGLTELTTDAIFNLLS